MTITRNPVFEDTFSNAKFCFDCNSWHFEDATHTTWKKGMCGWLNLGWFRLANCTKFIKPYIASEGIPGTYIFSCQRSTSVNSSILKAFH